METMGERIKRLRQTKGITQEELAQIIGLQRGAIAKYEIGLVENMKQTTIKKMADYFNVNPSYLMCLEDNANKDENKITSIPVLGIVKAGYDYLAEENIIGYVSVNDNSLKNEDFFALKVKGNSMIPEIYENDIAIVKKQADFENGDYVVALINGEEATIKTGYKTDTGLLLKPANNAFPKLEFDKNDIEKLPVKIIGVVYNITRSFK